MCPVGFFSYAVIEEFGLYFSVFPYSPSLLRAFYFYKVLGYNQGTVVVIKLIDIHTLGLSLSLSVGVQVTEFSVPSF